MHTVVTGRNAVIEAITDVNIRSAKAKQYHIFELGSLNDLISKESAERVRKEFIKYDTPIKQITNHRQFASWTEHEDYVQQNLTVKYVPAETFAIDSEILIFDDTVAIYRLTPGPMYLEITDRSYAKMMRQFFFNTWQVGDSLMLSTDGSTLSKQYQPIAYIHEQIPVVLYPAKDDGMLEKAFSRTAKGSLETYVSEIVKANLDYYRDSDMILAYVWNQEDVPYADVWKVSRNDISDDSGFLYDVRVYQDKQITTGMGVASGNSSIVVTAEEMLLRELVIKEGKTLEEASDRSKYQARFPVGYVPDEEFYL